MDAPLYGDRYRAIALLTGQIIWSTNELGQVIEDLPTWRAFTGQELQALLGDGWMDAIHPDDRGAMKLQLNQALMQQTPYEIRYRLRHHSGEYRPIEAHCTPMHTPDGTLREWLGLCRDMTSNLQEATTNHLALSLEAFGDAVVFYDRSGKVERMNTAAKTLFGLGQVTSKFNELPSAQRLQIFRVRDASGKTLAEEDWVIWKILHEKRTIAGAESMNVAMTTFDGRDIAVNVSGSPIYNELGQITGGIGLYRDQTQQRRLERTQQASEQRYRSFFEATPDATILVDQAGIIVQVNQIAEVLFGYIRTDLLGQSVDMLLPTRLRTDHAAQRAAYNAMPVIRPMSLRQDLQARRHDGSEFPVEIGLSPLVAGDGTYTITTIRDISERKRIQESQFRYHLVEQMLDELPIGAYLVVGAEARLVMANSATHALLGAPWEVGQPYAEFLASHDIAIFSPNGQPIDPAESGAMVATKTGQAVRQWREMIRNAKGKTLPIIFDVVPFKSELLQWMGPATSSATEFGALVVIQDMTIQREIERIKDDFIATATHELRTPITVLKGYTQLLNLRMAQWNLAEDQCQLLEEIDLAANRLKVLTDDLLDVTKLEAGKLHMHLAPIDLLASIRKIMAQFQLISPRHTLQVYARTETVMALCDVARMEQVITNLVSNAIKYSPDSGMIRLILQTRQQHVLLAVTDNGIGISHDLFPRIFGRLERAENATLHGIPGTGLGLYLSHGLVEQQGGQMWFVSALGKGSTFFVRLPSGGAANEAIEQRWHTVDQKEPEPYAERRAHP
jgi:protein-histidine pros-kinase